MRLLLCVTLLCALAFAISVDAATYKQQKVVRSEDLQNLGRGHSIEALSRACDARHDCVGFTEGGKLKKYVQRKEDTTTSPHHHHHSASSKVTTKPHFVHTKQTLPTPGNIWPAPQTYTNGITPLQVQYSPSFLFDISYNSNQLLVEAVARYQEICFPHNATGGGNNPTWLTTLTIQVEDLTAPLQLGMNENYTLTIPNDGTDAVLTAPTYFGALRGLETFSQLVMFDFVQHIYVIGQAPWYVVDAPRFQHRGVMIDTARHFEPVRTIKTVLDSLSYAKFNTLHWHMVDSQSFPFESRTYPLLWNGAFSGQERYTQEDMNEVVAYAAARGIRVIVEFDIPGHADSWCVGYPDVCPQPKCLSPLDPSTEYIYDLMQGVFGEVTGNTSGGGIFPDNYIHLGGDEVDTTCWTNTTHIVNWMKANNMTTNSSYMYIVEQAHKIVSAQQRYPINWEEVFIHFGSQLDKRTIIQIWKDHATLALVVKAGYMGILSNSDVWYLDHLDVPWQSFYLNDPFLNITNPKQQALILGGETCMWGETVDSSDIFNTIWPRAAAVAERLWSAADVNDTETALIRLERFRCLLNQRGIDAAPVNTTLGRGAPPNPGGCYVQ